MSAKESRQNLGKVMPEVWEKNTMFLVLRGWWEGCKLQFRVFFEYIF